MVHIFNDITIIASENWYSVATLCKYYKSRTNECPVWWVCWWLHSQLKCILVTGAMFGDEMMFTGEVFQSSRKYCSTKFCLLKGKQGSQ